MLELEEIGVDAHPVAGILAVRGFKSSPSSARDGRDLALGATFPDSKEKGSTQFAEPADHKSRRRQISKCC